MPMDRSFVQFALLTGWLLFAMGVGAQGPFRVGISMGQVYPAGSFRSTDTGNDAAGYAQTGFTLNVDGDYQIRERLSLSARFHFGNAPIDGKEYTGWLKNNLGSSFPANDTVLYDITFWQWAVPLIGLKYHHPLVRHTLYVDAGLFSGISFNQIPYQNLRYYDKENERYLISENRERNTLTLPVLLTVGLRYSINKTLEIKAEAGWFGTKLSYEHVAYYAKGEAIEEIVKTNRNIPVSAFSASIGLVYRL